MTAKAYEVHLEVFEGPLDLLLHLIKKADLDVTNIPISEITKEYLAYLELMKELNLEIAGDFLVMATTLMQIKAQSLLPSQESSEDEGPDPRAELVSKLVEYQKFKQAASFLDARGEEFRNVFYRGLPRFSESEKSLDIRIFDLLSTLREVLDRIEVEGDVISAEEQRIEDKIEKILGMLEEKPYVLLRDIFESERTRRGLIICFVALLELIKVQKLFARQEAPFADILIYKKVEPVVPVWASDPVEEAAGEQTAPSADNASGATADPATAAAMESSPDEGWTREENDQRVESGEEAQESHGTDEA